MNKQPPSQWRIVLSRYVRSEMVRHGISYADLSARLKRMKIAQSEANLRNKISKGIMGADLLLQILVAMEVPQVRTEEIKRMLDDVINQPPPN